jgi:hypothetical protein
MISSINRGRHRGLLVAVHHQHPTGVVVTVAARHRPHEGQRRDVDSSGVMWTLTSAIHLHLHKIRFLI